MNNRQSLILLTAITAALAAPLSFAQSAHSSMTAQEHAAAQATTPAASTTATEDAGAMAATPAMPATPATAATPPTDGMAATAATPATPATAATPSSSAKKVSWSELDTDSSGTLSKAETASVESLSEVFDKADANADGALSTDEYKAYLAMNGKAPHKK